MEQSKALTIIAALFALSALLSCAGSDSGSPSVAVTESGVSKATAIDHRPARDTVDWQFVDTEEQADWSLPTDREWPGEEIGVIGPIIAMGGRGSKSYVAVYDPGGIFIGALYLKEARKDPSRLENLLRLAQVRGFVQNNRTIDRVALLRFLDLVREARQKEMP